MTLTTFKYRYMSNGCLVCSIGEHESRIDARELAEALALIGTAWEEESPGDGFDLCVAADALEDLAKTEGFKFPSPEYAS